MTGDNATWRVAGASRTGPHHARRGEPNQDRYRHHCDGATVIVAVADGAGSLADSGTGAQLAVDAAVDAAASHPGPLADAALAAVAVARDALLAHPDAATLGCTLVLAVANSDSWAVVSVGDSFAVVTGGDGSHTVIRCPAAGEYANITRLLTSPDPEPLLVGGSGRPAALTVASDGLAFAALTSAANTTGPDNDDLGTSPRTEHAHPGFFTPLVRHAADPRFDLAGLLAHMADHDKLDDDTTVVVAVPR